MSKLTDGLVDPKPDPALANMDTTREQPTIPDGPDAVPVYLVNGVRTSQGPGPGVKYLPPLEANALIRARQAVAGTGPPRGYQDGGQPEGTTPAVRPFFEGSHNITPRAGLRG